METEEELKAVSHGGGRRRTAGSSLETFCSQSVMLMRDLETIISTSSSGSHFVCSEP